MKLRRRFDEMSEDVSRLTQQQELLLTQMADDQADWEKRQQVGVSVQDPLREGRGYRVRVLSQPQGQQAPSAAE
jgi:hypothetical protein